MKFCLFSSNLFITIFVFIFFISFSTLSEEKNIKKKLKEITNNLRCMTCQNQTIYESETEFAIDIKKIVLKKLKQGEDSSEIIDYVVKRYGEYILFKPRLDLKNIFLWSFPFIVLIFSLSILFIRINKNKKYK